MQSPVPEHIQNSPQEDPHGDLQRSANLPDSSDSDPSLKNAASACASAAMPESPPFISNTLAAPVRWALGLLAVLSLITGIVGIFVPGLPTTVFILIAGWAAARSSPRLYSWLWQHKLFGPMLRNWHQGGYMSRKAKWSASAMMALCAIIVSISSAPLWAAILAISCMSVVLIWLWLRPLPPNAT